LGQKVRCAPVHKPTALDADDVAEVVHHFSDAALRLQPVAMVNADARALIAQLAQDAAGQGWLHTSEADLVGVAETAH
jgi:ketosteroid isomerase-like protein